MTQEQLHKLNELKKSLIDTKYLHIKSGKLITIKNICVFANTNDCDFFVDYVDDCLPECNFIRTMDNFFDGRFEKLNT